MNWSDDQFVLMKQANALTALIAAAVLLAIGSAQTKSAAPPLQTSPATPCQTIGRYQIFTAEHMVSVDGGSVTMKDILRIDTVTTAVQISSGPAMAVLIQQDIAPPAACFEKAGWGCHGGGV